MIRNLLLVIAGVSWFIHALPSPGQQSPITVSLGDVLNRPQDYQGKTIAVRGYLVQSFENSALYPNEHWQGTKGIWVTPTVKMRQEREKLSGHYVALTGIFNANDHGHLGQFKGTVTVRTCELAAPPDKGSK